MNTTTTRYQGKYHGYFSVINIGCPPFISSSSFMNKMICNTLRLLLQSRIWYSCVGKNRLIVTIKYVGPSTGMPIILNLYLRPLMYSQPCFIATNSEPNDEDSTDVCFLLHQYTRAQLKYIRNPVLDCLDTVSHA